MVSGGRLIPPSANAGRRLWLGVVFALLPLYGLTAHWGAFGSVDTDAANWPAWTLVHHGTFYLDGVRTLGDNELFQVAKGHLVSNRMAGVVLAGVPAQALLSPFPVHPAVAGCLTAVVLTAVAVANLAVVMLNLGGSPAQAWAGATALGVGTAVWTVASTELWTHTVDIFCLSFVLLALSRGRLVLAGLSLAPALWARPHLAIVAAVIGCWLACSRRSVRPGLAIGIPCGVALFALAVWNSYMFGHASTAGGYEAQIAAQTAASRGKALFVVVNILGGIASPLKGALVYSPLLLIAGVSVRPGWKHSPDWARAAIVGGGLYLLAQYYINGFTGGSGFYSNRLIIETCTLGAPLTFAGYLDWSAGRFTRRYLARVLTALSFTFHGVGAIMADSPPLYRLDPPPWRTWHFWDFASQSLKGYVVMLTLLCVGLAVAARPVTALAGRRPARTGPGNVDQIL